MLGEGTIAIIVYPKSQLGQSQNLLFSTFDHCHPSLKYPFTMTFKTKTCMSILSVSVKTSMNVLNDLRMLTNKPNQLAFPDRQFSLCRYQ